MPPNCGGFRRLGDSERLTARVLVTTARSRKQHRVEGCHGGSASHPSVRRRRPTVIATVHDSREFLLGHALSAPLPRYLLGPCDYQASLVDGKNDSLSANGPRNIVGAHECRGSRWDRLPGGKNSVIVDSVYFKGHLCFKGEWSGFDTVKPINVIIGRNNSGKSHLLDLVEVLCDMSRKKEGWQYRYRGVLDEASLRTRFSPSTSGGRLKRNHWQDHGQHFVDVEMTWETDTHGNFLNPPTFPDDFLIDSPFGEESTKQRLANIEEAVRNGTHRLTGKSFRRLLADRDIATEPSSVSLSLGPDGRGASNIVRRFINTSNERYPREVVQHDLLKAVGTVFGVDGHFDEIQIKEHDENGNDEANHWEIYLGEDKKGLIPLSRSGSGLKTVLLVLLNLLVVPQIVGKELSEFVFAFEELENNLHPALLRRLFRYLEEYAVEEGAEIFLTTHSSTALDFFGTSEFAQIIHVTHDGQAARAAPVSAHFDRMGVVAELGARPSDLLQANGIIWLEGPSDRIYLDRWIELCSDGALREGRDYQCAFYGGSILARTQFASPEEADPELANLLRINPNVVVVCDGDRSFKGEGLKDRVKRIQAEIEQIDGGFTWVTCAREIENYIPGSILGKVWCLAEIPNPGQYESFFPRKGMTTKSYVEANMKLKNVDKVELASESVRYMTRELMATRFDWKKGMDEIVDRIESWRG